MNFDVRLQQEAVDDIRAAFDWYEAAQIGLGERFLSVLETVFEKVSGQPDYYSKIDEQYRSISVPNFPYLVIYEVEQSTIIINSVFHTKRKPRR